MNSPIDPGTRPVWPWTGPCRYRAWPGPFASVTRVRNTWTPPRRAAPPGYAAADLKLNYQINRRLRLFAGIDNVTDAQRDFSDSSDFRPVAGRFLYAGVSAAFGD